ncbi:hypothetical protein G3O08_11795 [Cryomorpha ignava]|uniref:Glucosamine inositolphosphorylceramide transferase 1 N-terminal domain-containing protein n=1 Tax=Cryomorpha ignava TaxID=101383 RepID=A0A7K3WU47_9FLAO|nr:hypothetical protein [Cryomorpha ignava]NEN24185.1 hypothetical protein [Cryomorpha ignava]
MKKGIVIFCFTLAAIVIIIINNRTPFFLPATGAWSIGCSTYDSIPTKLNIEGNPIFSIERLTNMEDSALFLADPFFIIQGDTTYIFFEYQTNKVGADIAVMKSADAVNFKYDRVVLDEHFHLSYPSVFKHHNSYYMLPETGEAGNVLLYKSYNFPYDWRVCDTLIKNVVLYDPSIYLSDSLNFLIASDPQWNLYMYEADSLFGKWSKRKNGSPIRSGTEARPAGRIFVNQDEQITIPLQNRTKGYGYGVSFYQLNSDKENNLELNLTKKFFLKAKENIDEFSGGMHHVDIQKYKGKYFIVYDGTCLVKDADMEFNLKLPLKASYTDIKNYFYQ